MQLSVTILCLGLIATATASKPFQDEAEWRWLQFKEIHGKKYGNEKEDLFRRSIFEENLAEIKKHNEKFKDGLVTYSKAVNKFTDQHISEIIGATSSPENRSSPPHETAHFSGNSQKTASETAHFGGNSQQPAGKDWREVPGVVSEVKDQGSCGASWAFSATGALEGQWQLVRDQAVSLSEQQLLDCSKPFGTPGCGDGPVTSAYRYLKAAGGSQAERAYPYTGQDSAPCRFNRSLVVASITTHGVLPPGSETRLTDSITYVGPVAVRVMATRHFIDYHAGVFVDTSCNPRDLNQAGLAVGYGRDGDHGHDYYIIKASFGPDWGEHGYIRMARNFNNMCGIATDASFPIV